MELKDQYLEKPLLISSSLEPKLNDLSPNIPRKRRTVAAALSACFIVVAGAIFLVFSLFNESLDDMANEVIAPFVHSHSKTNTIKLHEIMPESWSAKFLIAKMVNSTPYFQKAEGRGWARHSGDNLMEYAYDDELQSIIANASVMVRYMDGVCTRITNAPPLPTSLLELIRQVTHSAEFNKTDFVAEYLTMPYWEVDEEECKKGNTSGQLFLAPYTGMEYTLCVHINTTGSGHPQPQWIRGPYSVVAPRSSSEFHLEVTQWNDTAGVHQDMLASLGLTCSTEEPDHPDSFGMTIPPRYEPQPLRTIRGPITTNTPVGNRRRELPARTARRCVFLHGIGQTTTGPATTSFQTYWGSVESVVPSTLCASSVFIQQDTTTRGWDNAELQEAYCALAVGDAGSSTIISDTVVWTHSMGNVILAAALAAGRCSFAADESSDWFAIAPPSEGAKSADMVDGLCRDKQGGVLSDSLQWLAAELSYCEGAVAATAYVSLRTDYVSASQKGTTFEKLQATMRSQVSGLMAGTSAWGLNSGSSAELEALATLVDYGEPNDSSVSLRSADYRIWGDTNKFSTSFTGTYYRASINHLDATCRNGDGWWGSNRMPCTWFMSR